MKHARHIIYLLIVAALATGCWGWVEYFDVAADEIKVPEGISDVIPQEGTTLTIDLTYEYVPKTKFEPGEDWKQYRYRRSPNAAAGKSPALLREGTLSP